MLYQQIGRNKRKTLLLVLLFIILVAGVGSAVGYMGGEMWGGLILAAIILAVYVPVTYLSANAQVLNMSGARLVSREENSQLHNIVEELCIPARIPMPRIYIVDDPSPNAFAVGIRPEKAAVAFTTGLLERLNREEIEGVAAHEISHIRNYDIRLMTISIALIGVVAILADVGTRMLFTQRRGSNNKKTHPAVLIIALVFVILSPLAARFVHLAVSRNREYLADASAIELTRNAAGLKHALIKINSSDEDVRNAKQSTAAMYIENPFSKERRKLRTSLFSTHPSIESRIERLDRM